LASTGAAGAIGAAARQGSPAGPSFCDVLPPRGSAACALPYRLHGDHEHLRATYRPPHRARTGCSRLNTVGPNVDRRLPAALARTRTHESTITGWLPVCAPMQPVPARLAAKQG